MTQVIAEVGSSHYGDFERGKKLIDAAKKMGCYGVKFQLFPNTTEFTGSGNVWLDPAMFEDLCGYAKEVNIACSASVFDDLNLQFLVEKIKPDFYKFAFSKKHQTEWIAYALKTTKPTFVSCDVMTIWRVPPEAKKLFCIPQYPVPFVIDFANVFDYFDGFSDHTLGILQTLRAIDEGAEWIEKHMKLDEKDFKVPDEYFAVDPECIRRIIDWPDKRWYGLPASGEMN